MPPSARMKESSDDIRRLSFLSAHFPSNGQHTPDPPSVLQFFNKRRIRVVKSTPSEEVVLVFKTAVTMDIALTRLRGLRLGAKSKPPSPPYLYPPCFPLGSKCVNTRLRQWRSQAFLLLPLLCLSSPASLRVSVVVLRWQGAMEESQRPLRLRCSVQNYDWGRIGEESTVARLFEWNSGADIEMSRPYAELWMGTHASGPSFVVSAREVGSGQEEITLKKWIGANSTTLGDKVVAKWGNDLPFLFKILSVSKSLSIQAHPDKELASILHKIRPNVYKDPNHKPEMAIALTEFQALCGFVSTEEFKDVLIGVPEIRELISNDEAIKIITGKLDGYMNTKSLLQSLFVKLMTASKDAVLELVSRLKLRLEVENKIRTLTEKEHLVLLLEKQYQADVGVLAAFFFNYVKLSPGEAIFIGPNEPHAYISGECIECMAASDNVVRAGLTPKYIDVQTLCSMLTYKQGFPQIVRGVPFSPYISRYTPPFDEFEVDHCILPSKESVVFSAIPGPSIFIVVAGKGRMQMDSAVEEQVKEGDVYFVPAQSEIKLSADADRPIHLYRAGVNSRIFA